MNMTRKFITLLIALTMILSSGIMSFADTNVDTTEIELDGITLTIPYKSSTIKVEYSETDIEFNATIMDKKTDITLASYGSVKILIETRGFYTSKTIYEEIIEGPTVSRLYTYLTIYSDGSFQQIDSANTPKWKEMNSGNWLLANEDARTISRTGIFPTLEVETSGDATIEVITDIATSGSFSVSAFEIAGFEVTEQVGSTVYLRKAISSGYSYSVN